jgi:glutaredoxin 3
MVGNIEKKARALINSAPVVLFGTVSCGYCLKAKRLLASVVPPDRPATFQSYDLDRLPTENSSGLLAELIRIADGHDTVPLIFIAGEFVGGFSEIDALNARGELAPLVRRAARR